ncbi:MAG: tetratricopeptide repeat protein [Luteolibacter sp.]
MYQKFLASLIFLTALVVGLGADSVREGDQAMASGLWEVAAKHYERALSDSSMAEQQQADVRIALAEAKLRDGRPYEALALLDSASVSSHPRARFWRAQALAASGKNDEAIAQLSQVAEDPQVPIDAEAVFTLANLHLAEGDSAAAIESLRRLSSSSDPLVVTRSRIRQVEIFLDLGQLDEAGEILNGLEDVDESMLPSLDFLRATWSLRSGDPAAAIPIFRKRVEQAQGMTLRRYHLAACGLAESLIADGKPSEAVTFIISFLRKHASSDCMAWLFELLKRAASADEAAAKLVLESLAAWIPPSDLAVLGPLRASNGASAAWPRITQQDESVAFAILTRAEVLIQQAKPDDLAQCRSLLTRLRVEFPGHDLSARSMLLLARLLVLEGHVERAREVLDMIRWMEASDADRGQVAFLAAKLAHQGGDDDLASRLFAEAAEQLGADRSAAAQFNAWVLAPSDELLTADLSGAADEIPADIVLERALAQVEPTERMAQIESFLMEHPDHERAPEARLIAAEAALLSSPPDLSFVGAQLDTLDAADPAKLTALDASRLAMLRLRFADFSGDTESAMRIAREIAVEFSESDLAIEASMVLGKALFLSEAYNEARLVLEKVAESSTDSSRSEVACLLAARAAALVPTKQSQQEALVLFRKVMDADGVLAAVATLDFARLVIDLNRFDEAVDFLGKRFASMEESDPMRMPVGLLLGEAIYARGGSGPDAMNAAIRVYDSLLKQIDGQGVYHSRLQYLRGRALEQVPDERSALTAYYSVLEREGPPQEWHYFELSGFRALALLEKAGRWPAAIACARRIAAFGGPRAAEAAERASQLQLKYMIWEE